MSGALAWRPSQAWESARRAYAAKRSGSTFIVGKSPSFRANGTPLFPLKKGALCGWGPIEGASYESSTIWTEVAAS
jgi:hypothetical protein